MDCTSARLDRELLHRELQDMLREDEAAILHALWCPQCASREVAEQAIALAGWTVEEFLQDAVRRAEEKLHG